MVIRFQILDSGGTVIGSSGDKPFELQPNDGRLPPKLVSAIFAMQTGSVQKVPLKAADAFGEIDPEKRFPLDPSGFQEKPQVGMSVQLQSKSGEPLQAKIVEVSERGVIADANHPLAGKDLTFAVTVLEGGAAPAGSAQPSAPAAPSTPVAPSPPTPPTAPPAPKPPPQAAKTAPATSMTIRFQIIDAGGSVIGSSGDKPFELQPNDGRLPPKLVSAIFAMQTGSVQKVPLKAADAFGEIDPEKRFPLDPSGFQEKPQVGMSVQLQSKSGEPLQAKIVEVSERGVIADANHPLAGKDLTFAVTVLEGGAAPAGSGQPSAPAAPSTPTAPSSPTPPSPPAAPSPPATAPPAPKPPSQAAKTAPATTMTIRFQMIDAGGNVIGSSGDKPFELQPNDGRLPPKLVSAIFEMQTGSEQKVPLKAADAFGEMDPEKRFPLDPSGFKEKPQVGMSVQLQSKSGEPLQAKIVEVSERGVIADANHPLAGKDLTFAVTVLEGGRAPGNPAQPSAPAPPAAKAAPPTNMTIRFQMIDAGGNVIGSSGDKPFELQPNDGRLPPKLVSAIFAMQTGSVQKVPLKAADAFGEIDPEKRFPLDPSGFKEKPQVGMAIQLQSKSGEPLQAKIVEVSERGVIADANHPLAGKDLTFAVTVLEGGAAPAGSAPASPQAASSPAPETPSSPATDSQSPQSLPFIGSQVLRSDPGELPRTPPPPPQPGMETVGFLDTSGYNITGL